MNREQIRLLNSKTTDLNWYYSKLYQKLDLLIRDLLFTTFVKKNPRVDPIHCALHHLPTCLQPAWPQSPFYLNFPKKVVGGHLSPFCWTASTLVLDSAFGGSTSSFQI